MQNQLRFGDYVNRWLFSTNAKDIAVLYFIFSLFCGILGSFMSLVLRLELAAPGNQLLMGNHQLFNVIVTAHAVLMVFFLIMPVTMGFFGKEIKRMIMIDSNNYYKNKIPARTSCRVDKWGPYLAGLIEGDGTIVVSNEIKKLKNSPIIEIVFNKKDLELAKYLYNLLKIGKIKELSSEHKYVLWRISKIEDVYILINIINGYFRTPKYEALVRAINWINNYITINKIKYPPILTHSVGQGELNESNSLELLNKKKIESILDNINYLPVLDIDKSEINTNGWLSGFTDADGNFEIELLKNSKRHKSRVNLSYILEIRQDYIINNIINDENNSYSEIMMKIAKLFNSKVYSRERDLKLKNQVSAHTLCGVEKEYKKIRRSYIISVNSKLNLLKVKEYFNTYPLLSSKYLDYKDWESILNLIDSKNSFTDALILDRSKEIKRNFNSTRVFATFDHLNNNYYNS